MPLLGDGQHTGSTADSNLTPSNHHFSSAPTARPLPTRRQSQHSTVAQIAIMSHMMSPPSSSVKSTKDPNSTKADIEIIPKSKATTSEMLEMRRICGHGTALTDTPISTAPSSPRVPPRRQDSGSQTSRIHPTTLDIPGLTKSKVSPDGRIAQRDVGSKLVIVMVGLPARGKSYITKKLSRYLNWLQHDTRIFNVGERRRIAAGIPHAQATLPGTASSKPAYLASNLQLKTSSMSSILQINGATTSPRAPMKILINGESTPDLGDNDMLPPPSLEAPTDDAPNHVPNPFDSVSNGVLLGKTIEVEDENTVGSSSKTPQKEIMDQSASFFDPKNAKAVQLREEVAMATLDDLLDYILEQGGAVGIFDATNSTLERRKLIMRRVRERAGPQLGVLFLESLCLDEQLLESNMRLKLSGPDYKDQDPVVALEDFKKRVELYQEKYVRLGDYEERNDMQYVQMIDVGRKVVSHQIHGFLAAQTVYYLLNFNLCSRQIWITRHGESLDNVRGKIGGDSDLSETGRSYAKALTSFIKHERKVWTIRQREKALFTHFPPLPGDTTPPNPHYSHGDNGVDTLDKNFCIWTSMLKRSIQTARYFDEEEFDIKQMKMLDELHPGIMEGLTYEEIKTQHPTEYESRKHNKLHYRYPGAGGESYLDIINRLRTVIVEVERMTDHVLLVVHRSVARVLLAYFKGLERDDVADLDVPLGMVYVLEPKPYGVEFKAYSYNAKTDWFDHVPGYRLRRAEIQSAS